MLAGVRAAILWRQVALTKLVGIEERVWIQVEGSEPVWPIADEDLDRATEEKTSAVHFLRFELTPEMSAAVQRGAAIQVFIGNRPAP